MHSMMDVSNSTSAEPFCHDSLPGKEWNRLVRIQPELVQGTISCDLIVSDAESENCIDYDALSYEWGDPTPRHTILINGRERKVATNLWGFMNWVRSKEGEQQYWWIDSLCLNQSDQAEMNCQIARMGEIYSQAQSVTIWVGNHSPTEDALSGLHYENVTTVSGSELAVRPRFLQDLLADSYWQRVWISQEVIQARQAAVVSRTASVDLDDLWHEAKDIRAAARRDRRNRHLKYNALSSDLIHFLALTDTRNMLRWAEYLTFWDLLARFMDSKSTLAIDAVYGLVGLATNLCPAFSAESLDINYAKDAEDVFWDTLFEAQPPWPEYHAAYRLLRRRLTPERIGRPTIAMCEHAADLKRYMARSTTSERHRRQARVCLEAVRALCFLRTRTARKHTRHGSGGGGSYSELLADRQLMARSPVATAAAGCFPRPTYLQDAVALGLSLSCDGMAHQEETYADAPWRCGKMEHGLLDSKSVCDAAEDSECDWRVMVLEIAEAGFRLEIPRKKGTLRIDWDPHSWRFMDLRNEDP